jgi:hypothetical protein
MARSLRTILNAANPNNVDSALQAGRVGSVLALSARGVRGAVVANVLVLPENARAAAILEVRAVAGTAVGLFTPLATGATPVTTEAAINAVGNIVFAAADAVTEAEVVYIAEEGDVTEDVIPVASNSGTLLANRRAKRVLEVTRLVGTDIGVATVVGRGATPADNQAAANAAGTAIVFNAADAVTSARVKYIAQPGYGNAPPPVVPALDAALYDF